MLRKLTMLICVLAFPSSTARAECITYYPKFDWQAYKKVSVVGNCADIHPLLESEIVSYKSSPYTLIERERLQFIAEELGLSFTAMMDPEALKRVGKLAGVDALVITQCRESGRNVSASMRFVDVTTGVVKAAYNDSYLLYRDRPPEPVQVAQRFYVAIGPCKVCGEENPDEKRYCE